MVGCSTASLLLAAAAWPTGAERFAHDLDALNPRPNPPLEAQADAERDFPAADATLPVVVEASDPASLREADAAVATAVREAAPALAEAAGGPVAVGFTGLSSLLPDPVPPPGFDAVADALRDVDLAEAAEAAGFAPEAFADATSWLTSLADAPAPDEAALRRHPLLASTVLPVEDRESADRGGKRLALATVRWTLPAGATDGARGRVVDVLGGVIDAVPGATATGLERGGRVIGDRLGGELAWMLSLAGVGVLAWLYACFRRVGTVALVLVPPAAGVLAVLAAGNLSGVPLNLLSVLALPAARGNRRRRRRVPRRPRAQGRSRSSRRPGQQPARGDGDERVDRGGLRLAAVHVDAGDPGARRHPGGGGGRVLAGVGAGRAAAGLPRGGEMSGVLIAAGATGLAVSAVGIRRASPTRGSRC